MQQVKDRVFSGTQPTGVPTLGNYVGAYRNWLKMQDDYDCLFCVVDMHSLTVRNDAAELRKNAKSLLALYLAVGFDPEKCILYFQSHVPEHAQLSWILNCYTYMGELSRMTQFKDKSAKHSENINAGLFTYPVLMAADILLFNVQYVPVGEDQKQHVEITRDIAERFNNIYGDVFTIPKPLISNVGARIMSLSVPENKMSKSDDASGYISMLDTTDVIISKFKKAVTDSEKEVRYDPKAKPGVSNLLTIYSVMTDKSVKDAEKDFEGVGYGGFKLAVGEAVADKLKPIQDEYNRIMDDKVYLESVSKDGAQKARKIAMKTYGKVARKVGLAQI
ncbi:MAG: tryptophan--tRNA ligase [Defluviitaleaceae bacterium]|nr:tryptophan--tRNA ligase [Defluviitaleaceae bacterium]